MALDRLILCEVAVVHTYSNCIPPRPDPTLLTQSLPGIADHLRASFAEICSAPPSLQAISSIRALLCSCSIEACRSSVSWLLGRPDGV